MQFKGILLALGAAFFFGLGPTFAKLSYGLGANPTLAIILRYALAVLIIMIPLILIKINLQLIKQHIVSLLIISLGSICLTTGLLVSVTFIPVSLVALIFYTYPLVVLSYTFFSEKKINQFQIGGFIAAFIGLGLALGPSFASLNMMGILLAFLASIGAATVLISNEHLSKYFHAIIINAFTNFVSLLVFCLIIVIKFNIDFPTISLGWSFVLFASFCYCLAFYLQLLAVKDMGSAHTSLLLYLEPIVAIIAAIILLNETLSPIQIIGTIIVISSLIATTKQLQKNN